MSSPPTPAALQSEAHRLGFQLFGVCRAQSPPAWERFTAWLEAGFAGEMHYLQERRDAYRHPAGVLEGARSVVMLGMDYRTTEPVAGAAGFGRISRYAWGEEDYHDVIHARLKQLVQFVRQQHPTASVRGVIDTAPLLEREFAQLAGLGWIGKNTMLIHPQRGSWFFLAALLTDLELETTSEFATDHCGTCTACLDACPTDAFPEPYQLDATRCISYLTIELRGEIPLSLRGEMGDWLFGCDICQDVCPWNRRAPISSERAFTPVEGQSSVDLAELLSVDDDEFRRRFRRTPMWRAKRRGLLRNAAIALGNQGRPEACQALRQALADREPLVREASAWALGRLNTPEARSALRDRLELEGEPGVRTTIEAGLR